MDIEKLSSMGIKRDTLVWHEGLENWVSAGTLPELSWLFANVPPELPTRPVYQPAPTPLDFTKTAKVFAILGIVAAAIMQIISSIMLIENDGYYNWYLNYSMQGIDYGWGFYYFFLSLFLLVFSIVVVIKTNIRLKKRKR